MSRKQIIFFMLFCAFAAVAEEIPSTLSNFTSGTTISSATMNAHFDAVETAVDDNASDIDALQAGTGQTVGGDLSGTLANASLAADTVAAAEMADADHGDVAWSGGVASVQAVGNNAVALSTDTTGNYVATIADSGASEVTVSGSGSEGAAVTLAIAASIMRDSEASALTVTTSDPTDGSDACDNGDMWLNRSGRTLFLCTDGSTDDWWGVDLADTP